MKKLIAIAVGVYIGLVAGWDARAESLTTEEAAVKLEASTGKLYSNNRFICTTWKIGPTTWATAAHCVTGIRQQYKIMKRGEGFFSTVRSILRSAEKGQGRDDYEDWALLHTSAHLSQVPSLEVSCEVPALGQTVVYFGYPSVAPKIQVGLFSSGTVSALPSHSKHAFFFAANFQGGGGSSGSPVLELKNGKVIGFVTGPVMGSMGIMAVRAEGTMSMDMCDSQAPDPFVTLKIGDVDASNFTR